MAAAGGNSNTIPAPTPNRTSSSDFCPVCLFTSKCPELITAAPSGPNTRSHIPLYKITLTLITGECFAPLAVMVLTLPLGFYEVMKTLIVHSQ